MPNLTPKERYKKTKIANSMSQMITEISQGWASYHLVQLQKSLGIPTEKTSSKEKSTIKRTNGLDHHIEDK